MYAMLVYFVCSFNSQNIITVIIIVIKHFSAQIKSTSRTAVQEVDIKSSIKKMF